MESPSSRSMRTFLIIWIGQMISVLGTGLTDFALGVWIYQRTHQATPFAITILFASLPRILLAPFAGSMADRWDRRYLMMIADTANALLTLIVLGLFIYNRLEIWQIYLVALFGSILGTFQDIAYTAAIPTLVPKKDLARASGMVQTVQGLQVLVAPLLASVLFGWIGLHGIMLIDYITYFAAIGTLFLVHIPQPILSESDSNQSKGHFRQVAADTRFGWRYLRERTGLFWLLMYFALINFLMQMTGVLIGPLVLAFKGAQEYGAVQAIAGLGMLFGSLLISIWGGPRRKIQGVFGFYTLAAVCLFVAGLYPSIPLIAVGLFGLMFFLPIAIASGQAVFQIKIDLSAQGRVGAMRSMIAQSAMPLAFLLAGPLSDRFFDPLMGVGGFLGRSFLGRLIGNGAGRGTGLMFVISGLILVIVSLITYTNPRIRNVEMELPDAIQEEAAPAAQVGVPETVS